MWRGPVETSAILVRAPGASSHAGGWQQRRERRIFATSNILESLRAFTRDGKALAPVSDQRVTAPPAPQAAAPAARTRGWERRWAERTAACQLKPTHANHMCRTVIAAACTDCSVLVLVTISNQILRLHREFAGLSSSEFASRRTGHVARQSGHSPKAEQSSEGRLGRFGRTGAVRKALLRSVSASARLAVSASRSARCCMRG